MGNCCSKPKHPIIPISIEPHKDLVDIEEERTRQFALALNVGKGPVKVEGKFSTGFETEKKIVYKRHLPEERSSSVDSVYEKIGPVPVGSGTPIPMRFDNRKFNIPTGSEPINIPPRRNSK